MALTVKFCFKKSVRLSCPLTLVVTIILLVFIIGRIPSINAIDNKFIKPNNSSITSSESSKYSNRSKEIEYYVKPIEVILRNLNIVSDDETKDVHTKYKQQSQNVSSVSKMLLQFVNSSVIPPSVQKIRTRKHTTTLNLWIEIQTNKDLSLNNLTSLLSSFFTNETTWLNGSWIGATEINHMLIDVFPNLIRLDISHNEVTNFVSNTRQNVLLWLDLSLNKIISFNGQNLKGLKILNLSCNNISSTQNLKLNDLINLEVLNLSGNKLYELDGVFNSQKVLKVLNLAWNSFSVIYESMFTQIPQIEILNLSNNNLKLIQNNSSWILSKLIQLDLSSNQLFPASMETLQNFPELVEVSIAFNPMFGNILPLIILSWGLTHLDASGCDLSRIPIILVHSISTLNVSNNHFEMVNCGDLDGYPQLQRLDISSCQIINVEDDAFGRLELLETLYITHNNISRFPLGLPQTLLHLYLQSNQITELQTNTLNSLIHLKILDLSNNQLEFLPKFQLPQLTTINLRGNKIKSFAQTNMKMFPKLKDILLDDNNPMKCSEMLSIAKWIAPCQIEKIVDSVTLNENYITSEKDESIVDMTTILNYSFRNQHCECKQ